MLANIKKNRIFDKLTNLLSQQVVINTGVYFTILMFGRLISFVFVIVVGKLYGPEVLGIYSLFFRILSTIGVLAVLGYATYFIRFHVLDEFPEEYRQDLLIVVSGFIMLVSFMIALILFWAKGFLAFIDINNEWFFMLLLIALPMFSLYTLLLGFMIGNFKIKSGAFVESVLSAGLTFFMFIVFAYVLHINPINSILLATTLSYVFGSISVLFFLQHKGLLQLHKVSIEGVKIILRKSLPVAFSMFITDALYLIMDFVKGVLSKIYLDLMLYGVYSLIIKLTFLLNLPILALTRTISPYLAKYIKAKDYKSLTSLQLKAIFISFVLVVLEIIGVFVFVPILLNWMGKEFQMDIVLILLFSLPYVIKLFGIPFIATLTMGKKQKELNIISGIRTIIYILVFILLTPSFKLWGLAFADIIATMFLTIAAIVVTKIKLKL